MDLTAAEAVADLVDAETEGQRRQALRQMHGALGALYEGWREKLISALALYEAEIDFPDEGLPEELAKRAAPLTQALDAAMTAHLSDGHRGERVREGYRVAIIGPPERRQVQPAERTGPARRRDRFRYPRYYARRG